MKLGLFEVAKDDKTRIGNFRDGTVSDVTESFDSYAEALERLTDTGDLPKSDTEFDVSEVRFRPPTTAENTTFAAALNYQSHISEKSESDSIDEEERGVPETPYFFIKLYRSLVGHDAPINYYDQITQQVDYAAELAVVIGKEARNVSEDEALDYVGGYTILNDTAAYDLQNVTVADMNWIDWFSAKSMERTTPVGPHVTPASEITDPQSLDITSTVNGDLMQDGNTRSMVRSVAEQISFLSTRVKLRPGDIIATGTPEGVGSFQDLSLKDGDTIEIEIEGLGTLSNMVKSTDL